MQLTHIRARNFLSFKELDYQFVNGVPTLLIGENRTDPGQESNGSGKSGIPIIIEYCALHFTSKKTTDANLIFWGEKDAEVELGIFCPIRKETLLITRRIAIKGGGSAQLSINGVVKYAFDDKMVDTIDREIIEWIGISKEDLQNFYILSKFKYTSFFSASNSNLIALIGRFSNSSIIDGIDKDILAEVGTLEGERNTLLDTRNRLYGRIEAHKVNIEKERVVDKKQLLEDRLNGIDAKVVEVLGEVVHYQTQISLENEKIGKYEDQLIEQLTLLQKAQKDLQALNTVNNKFEEEYHDIDIKINDIKTSKETVEKNMTALRKNQDEMRTMLQEINLNLTGAVKCPKCQHEFVVGNPEVVIEEEKEAKVQVETVINQINTSLLAIKQELEEFDPKIRALRTDRSTIEAKENEFRTMKRNLSNTVSNIEGQKSTIELNIKRCEDVVKLHTQRIDDLNKRVNELKESKATLSVDSFDNTERIKASEQEIENCNTELITLEKSEKEINDKIFTIKQWSFTFKEFTQYLSVKTLKVLQGYANHFLESIKSDLRVTLDGYKLKADGTLSEKITAYIIRDGETREFGNFSGGERVRLEAAMILTIQHAINSTHKFGGLDFLSIDEIFESSDAKGIEILTTSLMDLSKTILLTTHVANSQYECPILKVVKENRISKLVA